MEKQDMDIKEILDCLCGKDDKGNSLAQVSCFLYKYKEDDYKDVKEVGSAITTLPELKIYPNGDVCVIDLTFQSEADMDFYKMNDLLKKRLEANLNDTDYKYMVVFTILPISIDKEDTGWMEMFNPMFHSITSLAPKQPATTLRMITLRENINFYKSDFDETNTAVEADYEVKKRQDIEFYAEQKKKKNIAEAQYLDMLRRKNQKGV